MTTTPLAIRSKKADIECQTSAVFEKIDMCVHECVKFIAYDMPVLSSDKTQIFLF